MRVSEVYASAQGEGPNVGKTTVFLRFGGCNLRCPGWPCDTQHAIDPAFRNEWKVMSAMEVVQEADKVAKLAGAEIITFTGGEPFLQNNNDLREVTVALIALGYQIECFSNGTFLYPVWALEHITFIMDWKLPGSGENSFNEIRLRNVENFWKIASTHQAVKFVCRDLNDAAVAHTLWSSQLRGSDIEVFYGRVWESELTDAELVAFVMTNRLPWRLNRQEHNYIWPPNERGR